MRRPERLRYAEQTISAVTEHLVAGRLWSGEFERLSAAAPVVDELSPTEPVWKVRQRFLVAAREVLALLREPSSVETVTEAVRAFRSHVPVFVSRDRVSPGLVLALLALVLGLSWVTPLCVGLVILPAALFVPHKPSAAVTRSIVVVQGLALAPDDIAGLTIDSRLTYLVLRSGRQLVIGGPDFVQALREIGVGRV